MALNDARSPYWRRFATGLILLLLVSTLPASSAPYTQQTSGPAVPFKQFDGCYINSPMKTIHNTLLFFTDCYDESGRHVTLWRSNGSEAGTELVASLPLATVYPIATTNTTFFFYIDASDGTQLWKSDGTPQGTFPLKTLPSGTAFFILAGNLLYFTTFTSIGEVGEYLWTVELWRSDGTVEGTFPIKQMVTGGGYVRPTPQLAPPIQAQPRIGLVALNNILLIMTYTATSYTLWRSDGTPETTVPVKEFAPDLAIDFFSREPLNDSLLLFQRTTGQVWRTDGTASGTVPINLTLPTTSGLHGLWFETQFFQTVETDSQTLWSTNGTAQCTFPLVHLPRPSDLTHFSLGQSSMLLSIPYEDSTQLWKTDGTAYGTTLVRELPFSDPGPEALSIIYVDNDVHLILLHQTVSEETTLSLWQSDGTAAGTTLLQGGIPLIRFQRVSATATNDAIYFWTTVRPTLETPPVSTLWKLPRTALVPDLETSPTPSPEVGGPDTHRMMLPLVVDQC